jgi:hypothetical protein
MDFPVMSVSQAKGIVSHGRKFHVDEAEAIRILRKCGKKLFPGIDVAPVIFWDTDGEAPDGRTWQDWLRDGYILVGVAGSPFDEHSTMEEDSKDNESATSLVIKALNITDPVVLRMAAEITKQDNCGGSTQLQLPSLYTAMQRRNPGPHKDHLLLEWITDVLDKLNEYLEHNTIGKSKSIFDFDVLVEAVFHGNIDDIAKAARWVDNVVRAKHEEQHHFHTVSRREFEEKGKISQVALGNGKGVQMAVINGSDDEQVVSYAMSAMGGKSAIVLLRNSKGNYFISTAKKHGIRMDDLISVLRVEEQIARGVKKTTDFAALRSPGRVEGAECWSYNQIGGWIFNGRAGRGVEPSKLDIVTVAKIVEYAINQDLYCAEKCVRTRCDCFKYGLSRCRTNRFNEKNQKNPATGSRNQKDVATVTA